MIGIVTITMSNPYGRDGDNKIVIDWTSTGAGLATAAIATEFSIAKLAAPGYYSTIQPSKLTGFITKIQTIPGALGDLATNPPTVNYDITLTDAHSNDVAAANLMNRSAALAESYIPAEPVPVDSELTMNVTNAGAIMSGRMIIYISKER